MHIKHSSLIVSFLLFTGCAVGPDYKRPEVQSPENFGQTKDSAIQTKVAVIDREWWKNFNDPQLTQTVDKALSSNFDIKATEAQVDQVLGLFDQSKSQLYPKITGTGSFDRKGVEDSTIVNQPNGVRSTTSLSLAMSYEIDFYGKVRRSTEAAKAMLLGSEYNKRIVQLSVVSSVATSYIKLSSLHNQLTLAKESLKVAQELEKIGKESYKWGAINENDLSNLSAQVTTAKSAIVAIESAHTEEEGILSTLKGGFHQPHNVSPLDKITLLNVPSELPSDVLTKRPDILAAEQSMISNNAKIGIAYAGYFPSFSLTGMLGVQASELSNLTSSPGKIWQLTPAFNIPIFTAGMVSGQVKVAKATYDESVSNYQKSVINALNDAQNALTNYEYSKQQLAFATQRRVLVYTQFYQVKNRCDKGATSYASQLLAHQAALVSRKEEIVAKQNALLAAVGLYKAFGGGWDEKDLPKLPNLYPSGR